MSCNNEKWYSDFINPVIDKLSYNEKCKEVKLGPLRIGKVNKSGHKFFYLGEIKPVDHPDQRKPKILLMPRFVTRCLLVQHTNVKEMLRSLRRESLMIIVNYQFGFKQLEKSGWICVVSEIANEHFLFLKRDWLLDENNLIKFTNIITH